MSRPALCRALAFASSPCMFIKGSNRLLHLPNIPILFLPAELHAFVCEHKTSPNYLQKFVHADQLICTTRVALPSSVCII